MNLNDYQQAAYETAVYPERIQILYPALGLAGEAGEVANQIKKILRDDGGKIDEARKAQLKKELGDTLWYIAAVATDLEMDLSDIAATNLAKLADRQARGTLQGDGDNR